MAHIFASSGGGQAVIGFWYHFAIMFEALFILTIIDAGTRVGRFMLQDLLGHVVSRLWAAHELDARRDLPPAPWWSCRLGLFPDSGRPRPLGGINSLWPLFGISNQLLAAIAFCAVATTILLKMHGVRYAWITAAPLVWLVTVTFDAGWQKDHSPLPSMGFLAQANRLAAALAAGTANAATTPTLIFNARLDAAVCGILMVLVTAILIDSVRVWVGILRGTRESRSVRGRRS